MAVSLIDISPRNRELSDNAKTRFVALQSSKTPSLLLTVSRLAALIRRENPRVIVCWMYHAMIAGTIAVALSRRRIPVFWNVRQSMDDLASLSRSSRAAIAVCRMLSSRASGFIYNSSRAQQLHGQYGFRNHNAMVIPNGFDLPDIQAHGDRPVVTIGIAARLHPQKDHETFLHAAASVAITHPHVTFVAAGRGLSWDNPQFMELAVKTGIPKDRLILLGELEDMDQFYKSIDLLVLSSRTEGFPNVLAEAMSHGRPVVTTDVGDAATIAGEGGLTVPPRDPAALASAIRQILSADRETYARLARNARQRIEDHYTLTAVRLKYSEFLG